MLAHLETVLGYAKSEPRILRHPPRTLLHSGRILPVDGSWNGGTTHPDFQPDQSYRSIQGETEILRFSRVYLTIICTRPWFLR